MPLRHKKISCSEKEQEINFRETLYFSAFHSLFNRNSTCHRRTNHRVVAPLDRAFFGVILRGFCAKTAQIGAYCNRV